jgi:uncharacterized repeat protein (TIGR04138 family)
MIFRSGRAGGGFVLDAGLIRAAGVNFIMQKIGFAEALEIITARNPRYQADAYVFLRDALDYTIKHRRKQQAQREEEDRHVSGQELLEGLRQYALKEFGPMVMTVFSHWGVQRGEDFGEMVYELIRVGVFGKTDSDSIDDFKGCYDFREAFVMPFQPDPPAANSTGTEKRRPRKAERNPGGEVIN